MFAAPFPKLVRATNLRAASGRSISGAVWALAGLLIALPSAGASDDLAAVQSGDTVVITSKRVDVWYQDESIARLTTGSTFTVEKVGAGGWLGGYVERDGRRHPGWIRASYAIRLQDAMAHFNRVLKAKSNDDAALVARSQLWRRQGKLAEAMADGNRAVSANPRAAFAYVNRAYTFHLLGKYQQAIEDFDRAVALQSPADASTYNDRGFNRAMLGQSAKALDDYRRALKVEPAHALALNNLAWLRATCADERHRDGAEAVRSAKEACRLTDWKSYDLLDTLAAAHAETGDFDNAQRWIKEAVRLAPESQRGPLQQRSKLYDRKRPFRSN